MDVEPGLDKEGTEYTDLQVSHVGGEAEAPQGETEVLETVTAESQGKSAVTQEEIAETPLNLEGLETEQRTGGEVGLDSVDDSDYKPDAVLPTHAAADTAQETEVPQVLSSDAVQPEALEPLKPSPDNSGSPAAEPDEEVKEADKPQRHLFGRSRSPRPELAAEIVAEDGSKFKLVKRVKESMKKSRYQCLLCGITIQRRSIDDHLASKGHKTRASTGQAEAN
jgi:hypothetical protein